MKINSLSQDDKDVGIDVDIDGDTLNPQDITSLERLREESRKELKVSFSFSDATRFSKAVYDKLDNKYPTKGLERNDLTQTVYVSRGGKLKRTNFEEHYEPRVVDTFYISVNELMNLLKKISGKDRN